VAPSRTPPKTKAAFAVLFLLASILALGLAPRWVDGYLALQWTRHLAARNTREPRALEAPRTGRWAARAVDGLAPWPAAWEAARLSMDYARALQLKDAAAARSLLSPLREAVAQAEASRWKSLGMEDGLREEIERLQESYPLDTDLGARP
jgi:hypothetical protein